MTTVLENCKHAAEGFRASQQFHQALRKSKRIEKLLMAVAILTVASFTTSLAFAGDHDAPAPTNLSYAWVK